MGPGNDSGPSVPAFLLVSVFHISRLEFEANRMVFRVSRLDIRSNFEPVLCHSWNELRRGHWLVG